MQLNGSEIVVECLKEQGVDTVFGYVRKLLHILHDIAMLRDGHGDTCYVHLLEAVLLSMAGARDTPA